MAAARWEDVEQDRVSAHFVNSRLEELGEAWRVTLGPEGYGLPPLSDDPI